VTETTYTNLRQSLASVLDRVANDREGVIVVRKGQRQVAMVPGDELAGLIESAHRLRSPKNARRLLTASPESLNKVRRELGLATQS
jgi:antitoxin YefM